MTAVSSDDSSDDPRAEHRKWELEAELGRRVDETLEAIAKRMRQCAEIVAKGRKAFDDDWILRNAAHSTLIQIGEAAKDLPAAFRDEVVDVSWPHLIRTRDKTAHQYDQIDWDIVWTTMSRDITKDYEQVLLIQAARSGQ